MTDLKPYMCWAGDCPAEGAVLAFASTGREAKRLAFPAVSDWTGCDFIGVRTRLLRSNVEYLNGMKIKDGPHVNENPPSCNECGMWGNPALPEGGCEHCGPAAAALAGAGNEGERK